MEQCLLSYFIRNDELVNSCDFNPQVLEEGPGIYEVIRIINGKPLFLDEHIQRFLNSATHEKFIIQLDATDIKLKIRELIESNRLKSGNIRFQYIKHPEVGNLFILWPTVFHYPSASDTENGVNLKSLFEIRENPHSKRTNLPVRHIADQMIDGKTVSEVLLINNDGLVTEGSRTNIFFVSKNELITPLASLVLEGITRKKVIQAAAHINVKVKEEEILFNQLKYFKACFICSTSKSVLPVRQIDQTIFQPKNHLIADLSVAYHKMVDEYLSRFNW